ETFALYTWNAPALVQGALNAYQRDPKHTYPIDRNLPTNPNAQAPLIPQLTPARYDTVASAGTFVGWSNLGSYPEPGKFPTFAPRTTPQQALVFTPLENPVPISDQQINTIDGYLLKALDMFTAGFATKVGDNNYKYGTGQISLSQAVFLNLIEVATTTAAFAVSGAVASGVKVTLTEPGFKLFKSALLKSGIEGAAARLSFEAIEQIGANVVYLASGGNGGQAGLNLESLAHAALLGGVLGSAFGWLLGRVTPRTPAAGPVGEGVSLALDIPPQITGRTILRAWGKSVTTPNADTMTLAQAGNWLARQSAKIPDLVSGAPDLKTAVAAAYRLLVAMRQGGTLCHKGQRGGNS
ncbi:MAG: hypothetical protein JNM98_15260, partial [Rhodocyclaceae bacterium]|nr:hypothetical protein [Rhodocyclaceae bacterium]